MNKSPVIFLLYLCCTSLVFTSCKISQQLRVHKTEMQRLAYGNLGPEEKFDGLAEVMATVLEEGINRPGPIQTYRYLDKFGRQNEKELDILVADIKSWQKSMKSGEKLRLLGGLTSKDYTRKLVRLIPRFTKLINENEYKLGPIEKTLVVFKLKRMLK